MEQPDEYDDLCVTAVRDIFGRTVTYTPNGGAAVELLGYFGPVSQFMSPELGGLETGMPRLEIRTLDLEAAGISPTSGTSTAATSDTVTFMMRETERTYRVVRKAEGDVGMTMLLLGDLT
jgi:hypothetical protein